MYRARSASRWGAGLGSVLALALTVGGQASAAGGDTRPPAPPAPEPPRSRAVVSCAPGVEVRVFRPEFRPVDELLEALGRFGPLGATAEPVAPFVSMPRGKARVPVGTSLLLQGPPEAVALTERLLTRLDQPAPMVVVGVLIAESRCEGSRSSGGHLTFDRNASPGSPDTIYRGTASAFEPDAYLRSQLTGVVPFQGTTLTFGRDTLSEGPFEYVLRALSVRQQSDLLAATTLVVSEGEPAALRTQVSLPSLLLSSATSSATLTAETLQTGLTFSLTAHRIGGDGAVLDLSVQLVTADPSLQPDAPPGALVRRVRELTTRVTVRDGQPLVLGGLKLRRSLGNRRGLPLLDRVPALDVPLSARGASSTSTELLFVLRPRVLAVEQGPVLGEQRVAGAAGPPGLTPGRASPAPR